MLQRVAGFAEDGGGAEAADGRTGGHAVAAEPGHPHESRDVRVAADHEAFVAGEGAQAGPGRYDVRRQQRREGARDLSASSSSAAASTTGGAGACGVASHGLISSPLPSGRK